MEEELLNTFSARETQNAFSNNAMNYYMYSIIFCGNPAVGLCAYAGVVCAKNERDAKFYVYEQYEELFKKHNVSTSNILINSFSTNNYDGGVLVQTKYSNNGTIR